MYDTLIAKPRTSGRFASLMDLYEQNYLLVRLLAPSLRKMGAGVHRSEIADALPLELSGIEHNRYTTTFKLTYCFSDSGQGREPREPDLTIRLYHDACTCEVMSGLISSCRVESRRVRDLEQGYRLNRFLNKWLRYCLRQGHGFPPSGRAGAGQEPAPRHAPRTLVQSRQN